MKRTMRWYWSLAMVVPVVGLVFTVQSCVFDTSTYLCESGRRCKPGQVCAARQDVCIDIGGCGDGIINVERGEVCDDGNIRDGDGCSKDCKSDETCGNSIVDQGESCDDGNRDAGDGCSPDCVLEACGNSVIDEYIIGGELVREVCDDGNAVSGDGCRKDCLSNEVCGNGIIDWEMNEDGVIILNEECDPGMPGVNAEDCNRDCTVPTCGDAVYNKEYTIWVNECPGYTECVEDPGTGALGYVEQCDTGGDSAICDGDCTIPICGDGYTNTVVEECDPGYGMVGLNTPDCNANCTIARCGDGFFNYLHMVTSGPGEPYLEECDDGENGERRDSPSCDSDCTLPECGDGHANLSFTNPDTGKLEECDSGGVDTMDCDYDCTLPECGDGHHNAVAEVCDEGGVDTATCDYDCTSPECGDGHFNSRAEVCDTGGDTADCNYNCTLPVCGDGHINTAAGEVCERNSDCPLNQACRDCTQCV